MKLIVNLVMILSLLGCKDKKLHYQGSASESEPEPPAESRSQRSEFEDDIVTASETQAPTCQPGSIASDDLLTSILTSSETEFSWTDKSGNEPVSCSCQLTWACQDLIHSSSAGGMLIYDTTWDVKAAYPTWLRVRAFADGQNTEYPATAQIESVSYSYHSASVDSSYDSVVSLARDGSFTKEAHVGADFLVKDTGTVAAPDASKLRVYLESRTKSVSACVQFCASP